MPQHIRKCGEKLYEKLGLQIHKNYGCVYSQTFLQTPLLNGVLDCDLQTGTEEAAVKAVHSHFQELGLPYSWWVEDQVKNCRIKECLEKNGLNSIGTFLGMSHSLKALPSKQDKKLQQVIFKEDFSQWSHVIRDAFSFTEEFGEKFPALFEKILADESLLHFINMENEQAVSTASILFSNNIGYIYNIATRPSEQRKGYGKQLISELLWLAKDRGCSEVVLQASPAGVNLYKNAGFEEKTSFQIYI